MGTVVTGMLWFGAIGCGLIAGLYFAFSTSSCRRSTGWARARRRRR